MDRDRWRRIEPLFRQAMELPAGEMASFLDRACGSDEELRAEVEALLAADRDAGGLLERPAVEASADLPTDRQDEEEDLGASRQLGPYRLIRRIGAGGMGEVYLARDTRLQRSVAVKLLALDRSADSARNERFLLEAQAASALDHPNICTVHDVGTHNGRPYLVMAYYQGETLERKLALGPLPVDQAVELAVQVGRGLARAHEAGIVHRDVKPGNVMVTDRGEVKLLDFGIAKIAGAVGLTVTGALLGTPSYLSPEQARGDAVDARTDVWALGALLHEMLAGRRPFGGERSEAVIHNILTQDPAPLRSVRAEVPEALERIVFRALAKNPGERYPTMGELLHDLAPGSAHARRQIGDELTAGWRPASGQPIPRRPNWVLQERLGEGGFGEVWRARHKSGDTRVFKFCFEAARLRALKREVTLFRLLKEGLGHRHDIARIFDWSFDHAPYFLEVEHTPGGSLVDWAAAAGGLAAIELPVRLELVAEVAEALAAAHSVGILHKDVKPENVLVARDRDGRPRAQLTDFGIGLLTEEGRLGLAGITGLGFTGTSSPTESSGSGTVRYMAPELLEGKPASIQADIYSLGVMLYQIVAGDFSRALAPGWQRDVEDDLLAEDLAGLVDGHPERRPASALEVAERLRTLEPRRAAREAERRARQEADAARLALERAQRRRKLATAVAAAALAVLAVVGVLAYRERQARRTADLRQEQAEDLIGFMLGDLRGKLEPVGRLEILDGVGDKALEYFAAVPEAELSDAELARRSQALYQIGDVRIRQGRMAEAVAPLEESLRLAKALAGRDPDDPERLFDLSQSHFWLGSAYREKGDLTGALAQFMSYFDLALRLVEQEPAKREWNMELAYAYTNLGAVQEAQGDLARAAQSIRRSVEIKAGLAAASPDDANLRGSVANGHSWLARVLERQGDLRGALAEYQGERVLRSKLAADHPDDAQARYLLAVSEGHLAELRLYLGDPRAALAHLDAMQRLLQSLTGLDPDNGDWRRSLAVCRRQIGEARLDLGEPAAAEAAFRSARELLAELAAADSAKLDWQRDAGWVELGLAAAALARGDAPAARRSARKSLDTLTPMLKSAPDDRATLSLVGQGHLLLGRSEESLGNRREAQAAWSRAYQALEPKARKSADPLLLDPWARAARALGRTEESGVVAGRLKASGYARADFTAQFQ